MVVKTYTLEEFQKEAETFIRSLTHAVHGATVVGLYGDLGAGKTTFVQSVAKALGVCETVNSPTFLILKSYTLPTTHFKILHHIDAYRLKNSDELRKLRCDELLADPRNLILIEWADKVADLLPRDHLKISFEFISESERSISFS